MSLRINLNTAAMAAHRYVQGTDTALSSSIEKLSSGFRINSAADDPAGLAISENLRAQYGGIGQAIKNAQDAVNLIKTAEGALAEVQSQLDTIRERAVHAANTGVNDATALTADQTQIDASIEALDRISSQTAFGTKKLLDGTAAALTFQIGANSGETISASIDSTAAADLGGVAGFVNAIDVTVAGGADTAIQICDEALAQISTMRAALGAQQNGIESSINSLGVAKENIAASESTIRDTDMAEEMVNFTKNQILLQAGTAMLSQANMAPQAILKLLG